MSGTNRALTRLEKKLDTALVLRTARRLQLTKEGETFLQRAPAKRPRITGKTGRADVAG